MGIKLNVTYRRAEALGLGVAFVTDPWGTSIELNEGLDKLNDPKWRVYRARPALHVGVRYRVLRMAFFLAIVTYLDRVCISIATPFIMQDLGLTLVQMSAVFGAFTLAYSLFEVPSGWLGDVIGPRRVLTRIVLWWSAFTMLTGAAQGLRSLVAIRFLFGAGEAGAFPNAVRSFSQWFPSRERGMANGVLFFGSRLGGAITAPIALLLIQRWGWRPSFVVFGAFGLVWAIAWYRSYRIGPRSTRTSIARSLPGYSRIAHAQLPTPNSQRPKRRSRRRGGSCSRARISTPSARCISRSATACISTSRGCRPT